MGKGLIPADGEIWRVRRRAIGCASKYVAAMIGLFGKQPTRLCNKLDVAASDGEDREAEDRSIAPIPVWELPIWKDISPKLKKVNAALKLINATLDDLIAICKRMVDEEELQFHRVSSKQLRDDLMTMLMADMKHLLQFSLWTFYLLSRNLV
ncbi:hypothetical protein HAX54_019197 [Datura stramonium]|uniref:Cytochrome P450 n=1 Tax=Datura stramonium TaxID=4076 RepID=A0ABS8UQW2_DATST|nr:hypothetical protein [Datura stramonium]